MSDLRKLAAQALEYLAAWSVGESLDASAVNDLIANLDAALAQPEPAGAEDMEVYAAIANGYNKRTILEDFIVSLAHEVVKTPNASINDILESIGYVHKTKLPKPEQEPVAWWVGKESVVFLHDEIYTPNWTDYWTRPLYTHPPQRKPLTEEEICENLGLGKVDVEFVRIVEKAHGIGDLSNLFEADKAEGGEV